MTIPRESQATISGWGEATFGPVGDPVALARRARIEMEELIEALEKGDTEEAARETADVLILLNRLGTTLGFDLSDAVDAKMKVNRARLWVPAGDGTGRHVG
ncbi:MAG: dATP/dGTP pyrophosphohydrolase domain-containing protein [Parvibaculum sp.]|uniref:MazG-like family protein n=1 Tax=Parvibaculum sp. TaxID=2024848 RepID=UPI002ABAEA7E|nr:dATP/dGTP pyrophosphohydrolase domain-containing protein [Parvibaculum sp.]MDZ4381148.1 dATP/dGTP pyrophosphohydrolase domain-containing protein [Parvibaculum sp.]